mmetsp:Transcript_86211/g.244575  ORF Transcript_86211/g.244575 Transcript_86211/m.244575 type:complete len:256 (-) Transcript_86211:203-970(-)
MSGTTCTSLVRVSGRTCKPTSAVSVLVWVVLMLISGVAWTQQAARCGPSQACRRSCLACPSSACSLRVCFCSLSKLARVRCNSCCSSSTSCSQARCTESCFGARPPLRCSSVRIAWSSSSFALSKSSCLCSSLWRSLRSASVSMLVWVVLALSSGVAVAASVLISEVQVMNPGDALTALAVSVVWVMASVIGVAGNACATCCRCGASSGSPAADRGTGPKTLLQLQNATSRALEATLLCSILRNHSISRACSRRP